MYDGDTIHVTGSTSDYKVIVGSGWHGTLLLDNVTISSSAPYTFSTTSYPNLLNGAGERVKTGSPIAIMGKNSPMSKTASFYDLTPNQHPVTKVNIILKGVNSLTCSTTGITGPNSAAYYCGLQVDKGAIIYISAINPDDNSSGSLKAYAVNSSTGGAGIGSIYFGHHSLTDTGSADNSNQGATSKVIPAGYPNDPTTGGGDVIVSSGTLDTRGAHGAGIGGSYEEYYDGYIIVYGGHVKCNSVWHAAGIGGGCPNGTGVIPYYPETGAIYVIPPATIDGQGAESNTDHPDPTGVETVATYNTLAGSNSVVYLNDPHKYTIDVHTDDYQVGAKIYLDLTDTQGKNGAWSLKQSFDNLGLNSTYLTHVYVGTTTADPLDGGRGHFYMTGELQDSTTFFTDASSQTDSIWGRPYLATKDIVASNNSPATSRFKNGYHEIILKHLETNIQFKDYPSTPLEADKYTAHEALKNSFQLRIIYNDPINMSNLTWYLQQVYLGGSSDFAGMYFFKNLNDTLESDAMTTPTVMPVSGITGDIPDTFYVRTPLKVDKGPGAYSDVIMVTGDWKYGALTGYIRRILDQKVVFNDTGTNDYILVDAAPNKHYWDKASDGSVNLTLSISHDGIPSTSTSSNAYNPTDVVAKYLISTEPDYDKAVAALPVADWPAADTLRIPQYGDSTRTAAAFTQQGKLSFVKQTTAKFAGMSSGKYYIHWYVESGVVYAHGTSVINDTPVRGSGFGPYTIAGLQRDLATVQQYGTVLLDPLANDYLDPSFVSGISSLQSHIVQQPIAGELAFLGQKVSYKHTGKASLDASHSIDHFVYSLTVDGTALLDTAYIYVLQSNSGNFASCSSNCGFGLAGSNVNYTWYDAGGTNLLQPQPSPSDTISLTGFTADRSYQVQPTRTAEPLKGIAFPKGLLSIKHLASGTNMRWTGLADTNWFNPDNWVQIKGSGSLAYESPVTWAPTSCVQVEIPSGAPNYPELTPGTTPVCDQIHLGDRAMLKNPQVLTYSGASVEMSLQPSERDRYVMLSAPLQDMVSGDYHFMGTGGTEEWGDVYMDFFSRSNTGGNLAELSSSTGSTSQALQLGRAFNIRVVTTSVTRDSLLRFPSPDDSYAGSVQRTSKARFITDGLALDAEGRFSLPVFSGTQSTSGSNAGSTLLEVVNPYMAYLRVDSFLNGNPGLTKGYYIWNGDLDASFTAIASAGARYVYTLPAGSLTLSPNLIPPLQSFFVAKKSAATNLTVYMSPAWTTTRADGGSASYLLRSTATQVTGGGILNVTLKQGGNTAVTALALSTTASPARGDEDLPALAYVENPLTLYALSSTGQAMAVDLNNDFASTPTALGFRATEAGQATLSFANLATFGYKVKLTDKLLNKTVELSPTANTYTFTIALNGGQAVETDDRFVLQMIYTGNGVTTGTEQQADASLRALAVNGGLQLYGLLPGTMLRIYDAEGQLSYQRQVTASSLSIPDFHGDGLYVVLNGGRSVKVKL
ncbi:MAG: hypothetical protein LBL81_06720 [Tannerella sp.]|nr:hypothetical protein [Tannerella sp.]